MSWFIFISWRVYYDQSDHLEVFRINSLIQFTLPFVYRCHSVFERGREKRNEKKKLLKYSIICYEILTVRNVRNDSEFIFISIFYFFEHSVNFMRTDTQIEKHIELKTSRELFLFRGVFSPSLFVFCFIAGIYPYIQIGSCLDRSFRVVSVCVCVSFIGEIQNIIQIKEVRTCKTIDLRITFSILPIFGSSIMYWHRSKMLDMKCLLAHKWNRNFYTYTEQKPNDWIHRMNVEGGWILFFYSFRYFFVFVVCCFIRSRARLRLVEVLNFFSSLFFFLFLFNRCLNRLSIIYRSWSVLRFYEILNREVWRQMKFIPIIHQTY